MKLKASDLPVRLKSGLKSGSKYGPVPEAVLLYGQDQGLVMNSAAVIRRATFNEEHADFDLETFFGGDLNLERFLSSCQGYPFMAARRLVILKDADRIATATVKTVVDYVKKPSPSTLLLVLAGSLDTKNLLRKCFESSKIAWCIPFYPLEGGQLRYWLVTELQKDGFRVDADALQYLCEHLAGDTRNTHQELDKLKLFVGNNTRIELEDVLAMVGETTTHSGFGLSLAITSGQLNEALYILERLLESGEEPLMLLGIISQRLRRLAQCGELLAQGTDPKIVAGKLKIFWKEQARFFSQSRAIPARKLADGLLYCLEADKQLKGGSDAKPRQIMERFVMRLVSRFGGRR